MHLRTSAYDPTTRFKRAAFVACRRPPYRGHCSSGHQAPAHRGLAPGRNRQSGPCRPDSTWSAGSSRCGCTPAGLRRSATRSNRDPRQKAGVAVAQRRTAVVGRQLLAWSDAANHAKRRILGPNGNGSYQMTVDFGAGQAPVTIDLFRRPGAMSAAGIRQYGWCSDAALLELRAGWVGGDEAAE